MLATFDVQCRCEVVGQGVTDGSSGAVSESKGEREKGKGRDGMGEWRERKRKRERGGGRGKGGERRAGWMDRGCKQQTEGRGTT